MIVPKNQYCYTCGAKLITQEYKDYYDSDSGEQYKCIGYRCPKNAWYKFWQQEFYHFSH